MSLSHGPVAGGHNNTADGLTGFPLGNNNLNNQPSDIPHGFGGMDNSSFGASFNFNHIGGSTPGASGGAQGFDPMFGELPTNAFATPTAWHGDENGDSRPNNGLPAAPNDTSPNESAATTGSGEEKDPFLSLLEQLAENESFMGPGNELDFFLNGAPDAG
jgi:hypothetical protein